MALWEHNATRELPLVGELAAWLEAGLPPTGEASIVHGDYRLGNVMLDLEQPRVLALLDWDSRPWATRWPTSATSSRPGAMRTRRPPCSTSPP